MFGLGKKKELTHFEKERLRIQRKLETLEIGTKEYDQMQEEYDKLLALSSKEKDLKRKLTPEAKGKVVTTLLSGLFLGGISYGISRFQLRGNMFTGENKTSINSVMKIASRIFFGV